MSNGFIDPESTAPATSWKAASSPWAAGALPYGAVYIRVGRIQAVQPVKHRAPGRL